MKIKGSKVVCQVGQPKFECKIQGVIIQGAPGLYSQVLSVVEGTTFTVPAGKVLFLISAVPTASARTISAGYSAGATQVLDMAEVPANVGESFPILRRFETETTIHFSNYVGSIVIYLA